jgi:hypothetical protein
LIFQNVSTLLLLDLVVCKRNLMVHEYIDRAETLHSALYAAHTHVDMLAKTVERFKQRTQMLLG